MTATERRAVFVTLLAMLSNPRPPPVPPKEACPICGRVSKNETGECSFCGTYKCGTCAKYHIGVPSQPCNGHGVDLDGR